MKAEERDAHVIDPKGYQGNINLKRAGVGINWTPELVEEWLKCKADPVYFIEKYMKIVHIDQGLISFKLRDYQLEMLDAMVNNRYTIIGTARQAGKCVCINTLIDIRINHGPRQTITIGELYEYAKKMCTLQEGIHSTEEKFAVVRSDMSRQIQQHSRKSQEVQWIGKGNRLRYVRDLWLSSCRSFRTHSITQNDYTGLQRKISSTDEVREIFRENSGTCKRREKSGIQSRRASFSILEEIQTCGKVRSIGTLQTSQCHSKEEWKFTADEGVLSQERRFRGRSRRASQGTSEYIHVAKMSGTTWRTRGSSNLGNASEEVAEYSDVEIFRRNNRNQSEKNDEYRTDFQSRKRNSTKSKKSWIGNRNSVQLNDERQKIVRVRHPMWEKTDRVQRRFLALQPRCVRIDVCAPHRELYGARNLGKRREETSRSYRPRLRSHDHLGKGLQEKQARSPEESNLLSDTVERKFVDVVQTLNIEVWTDSGWKPVSSVNKTIPYRRWVIRTKSGLELFCADTHILFDENLNEVFAKDLQKGSLVMTKDGLDIVQSVDETDIIENMFDLSVNSEDHRFYSGGFLSHNSTTTCGYILWYIIFNEEKTVALLANKGETAREILSKIQLAYQHLPKWIQHGVIEWNKGSFELDNGSRVLATATSSDNIRGFTINLLFIDEAAHIENWEEFFASVFPTISSGTSSKVVLVSTPKGLNHFYKIWIDSIEKRNSYKRVMVTWDKIPGRDEKWKNETLAAMAFDQDKFAQEHCVEFMGSSGTLIAGWKLKELVHHTPAFESNGLRRYEDPIRGHKYVICCDVSEGKGFDYQAMQVIDVSSMPYKQVCTYRNNMTATPDYAYIVHTAAKMYGEAPILVETNIPMGHELARMIHDDLEYENVLYTRNAGSAGQKITAGFGQNVNIGIKTSKTTKGTGCSMLKLLIESNQLVINDFHTISELSTFSRNDKQSFEAEEGCHDDMVMGLVLFAWMSKENYFRDSYDINTLKEIEDRKEEEYFEELIPFGFFDDHAEYDRVQVEIPTVVDFERWMKNEI